MHKHYWVCLITDKPYGTLYVGVTSDLARRIYEHKDSLYPGFSKTYGLKTLVWCEEFRQVTEAIEAEKKIKK